MKPGWKKTTRFPINDKMLEICKLGIEASRAEQAKLRKKLEKLTYGS